MRIYRGDNGRYLVSIDPVSFLIDREDLERLRDEIDKVLDYLEENYK